MDPFPSLSCWWLLAPLLTQLGSPAHTATAQEQPPTTSPTYKEAIEVVGVTPIHGLGVPKNKVPGNIQTATDADLARLPGIHVGEALASGFASVHLNEAQANPFQPDLQVRGFAASPLLGLPQGIAVYQDGVRVNEPFGDTVNWDLLPASAIASVNLMPGSNPLFGLNALGGALSIQTKTGFTSPGHAARLVAGSFGRRWIDAESGGHTDRFSYFAAGRLLAEDGWRDFSPSRIRQVFGNLEWRGSRTTVGAAVTAAANGLIGNGAAPVQLLDREPAAVFTHPDETTTDVGLVTLHARRAAGSHFTLDAVAFYRPATVRTFNGDDTTYEPCEDEALDGLLCSEDEPEETVEDQFGRPIRLQGAPYDATNNTSATETRGWGAGLQAASTHMVAARANHFIAGASLDGARSHFESDTQIARLTDTRGTVATGLLDADAAVRLRTSAHHAGLYVADFLTVAPRVTLMGSARYNHSVIALRDQLGTALIGDHRFTRVNPAAGLTLELTRRTTTYGSFSVASRVPTPAELGCADPDDPCRLPNALVADPPLRQVVARTWEGGVRGRLRTASWTASVFRSSSRDDIIFISSGVLTNEGYFANVGDTRRRGLELTADGNVGAHVRWSGAYAYLRATFNTPLVLSSPNHPNAAGGEIVVRPSHALPSVPRHNLKANIWAAVRRLSMGATLAYTSSQFLRGDEANLLPPIAGSTLAHLTGRYALHPRVNVVARLANLFNVRYATFGLLGEADDVLGDEFDDPRFVSPGAPRAAWLGVEFKFP